MDFGIFKNSLSLLMQHPVIGSFGAVFGAIFSTLFGNSQIAYVGMAIFMAIIILDWISGYRASKIDGSYASEYGVDGAFRTVFILLFPVVSHQADKLMDSPNILFGFCLLAFGSHIWKSATANVVRCGWERWVPVWALEIISDELEHKIARSKKRLEEKNIISKEEE